MHPQLATISKALKAEEFLREGISFYEGVIGVDLSEPRTVLVHGVNPRTGETKDYLLKVTQSGKLLLI